MTETAAPAAPPKPGIVLEKAIFVSISRKWPPLGKSIDKSIITSQADPAWLSASKYLYKCRELQNLFNWDQQITAFIKSRCLPFPLKTGVYLLPKALFYEVENEFVKHVEGMKPLVEAFVERYDDIVKASKDRLKDQFNPGDYPTKEEVRLMFKFEWNYLKFGTDKEGLEEIDAVIAQREAEKYDAVVQEGSEAIRLLLRKSFQDIVSHLMDVLTPEPGGRKKSLRKDGFDPLNEFIRTFNPRDLTNDAELETLVNQAKALASGIAPESVKSSEVLAQKLQDGFGKLKQQVDTMIVQNPIRKIQLDD